jgi:hypothetical protein
MNHLENLIKQYYEWQGYVVRNNVKVGPRPQGGYEGELDIVAYRHGSPDAGTARLLHIEPSLDGDAWARREQRFRKKFEAGQKHIFKDVFPWLDPTTPIQQTAILISRGRKIIGGGEVVYIDEFIGEVRAKIRAEGIMVKHAIPEQFDLLRTIQLFECGYYRVLASADHAEVG